MTTRDTAGTPAPSRAQLIADTAIGLLATRGLRGLTHRAVDEAAGLPQGSTSNHARTRAALLETTVRRLAVREAEVLTPREMPPAGGGAEGDAEGDADSSAGTGAGNGTGTGIDEEGQGREEGRELTPGALADRVALALYRYLAHHRPLLVARYEIALEATRRPELRAAYDRTGTAAFGAPLTAMLKAAGSADPHRHTVMLLSWCDGTLFTCTAGTFNTETPTESELRASVREMLAGMLGVTVLDDAGGSAGDGSGEGSRRGNGIAPRGRGAQDGSHDD